MRAIDADSLLYNLEGTMAVSPTGYIHGDTIVDMIGDAPTIEPERKKGRWIFDENDYLTKCSECGCHPWFGVIPTVKEATKKLPHCPMCLARMEGD